MEIIGLMYIGSYNLEGPSTFHELSLGFYRV